MAGTLQGYGKVGTSAALASLTAALEALAVAFFLLRQENAAGGARASHFSPPLVLVGKASLAATALASLVGLALVQASAPEGSVDPLGLSSFLRVQATTIVPDEDTHGGVDMNFARPLVVEVQAEGEGEGAREEDEEPPLSMRKLFSELVSGSSYLFGRSICLQVR